MNTRSSTTNFNKNPVNYYGIVGFYDMPLGKYMAVIRKFRSIEDYPIPELCRIEKVDLIRIPDNSSTTDKHMDKKYTILDRDAQYVAEKLFFKTFYRHDFYFCRSDYDVTNTMQANSLRTSVLIPPRTEEMFSHIINSDKRFFWNYNTLKPLWDHGLYSHITPIVNAFITQKYFFTDDVKYRFALISRRSCKRQGPRYLLSRFLVNIPEMNQPSN